MLQKLLILIWKNAAAESGIKPERCEELIKQYQISNSLTDQRGSRDYKIEIDFKISECQLGLEQELEVLSKPKQKKSRVDNEL